MQQQPAAAGLTDDDYGERLNTAGELGDIQSALSESLEQIERNEERPAREVFAELRQLLFDGGPSRCCTFDTDRDGTSIACESKQSRG